MTTISRSSREKLYNCNRVIRFALIYITSYMIGLKKLPPLFHPISRAKSMWRLRTSFPALRVNYVFTSSFDCFTGFSVVCDWLEAKSDYCTFGLTTLAWKPLCQCFDWFVKTRIVEVPIVVMHNFDREVVRLIESSFYLSVLYLKEIIFMRLRYMLLTAWPLKCLWSKKIIAAYLKGFQSREKWRFPFWNAFFRSRDIYVFVVCKWGKWWLFQISSNYILFYRHCKFWSMLLKAMPENSLCLLEQQIRLK